jgi:hypothetical protein
MRDDAEILRRMIPLTGDLTKPGREADRVAVETANSRITNVMHLGSATGSEFEHGVREKYPNMYIYGSNAHLRAIDKLAAELKTQSSSALETVARQRGY